MKKIVLLLFLLVIKLAVFGSENQIALFESANKAYQTGNFEEAAKQYKTITEQGVSTYQVYFNLGNSYFKLKEYPLAILYYEKAQKLNPADEDIKHNLKLANKNITDKIEPLPEFFLEKLWNSMMLSKEVDSWAINSILFLFLSCGLFILYFMSTSTGLKKLGFYSAVIAFVFGLFSFVLGYQEKSYLTNQSSAIIFESSLTVKSAPDENGTKLFVIHEGTKIQILETLGEWNKVILENGNAGWIKSGTFETI